MTTIRNEVLAQKGDVKQCLEQFKAFVDEELTA